MNDMGRVLLCAAIIVIFVTAGLASVTSSEHLLLLDDLNAPDVQRPVRGVDNFNLSALSSPLGDNAARSTGEVTAVNGSSYPVHNLNTSANFSSIQEAIDAPNTTAGHIIEVDLGTYSENVRVNKSVTIRSSSGDPITTVVQAANANDHVFNLTADNVTISGFTIMNALSAGRAGIFLASAYNLVENNIVTGNYNGIIALNATTVGVPATHALNTHSATAFEGYSEAYARAAVEDGARTTRPELPKLLPLGPSRRSSSSGYGDPLAVDMFYGAGYSASAASHGNTICANVVSLTEYIGIALCGSSENIVQDNWLDANGDTGIYLESGNRNLVRNNTLTSNYWGIYLYLGDNNTLSGNTLDSNIIEGISLGDAANTRISNNTVNHQHWYGGISLWGTSSNATITNNNVSSNRGSGIILWHDTDNNTIANNDARYNGYSGIEVQGNSTKNTIKNNIASANNGAGISLWDVANNNCLNNNVLYNNGYSGIELEDFTNNNTITNNTASYNTFRGIALFFSSSDNTISQNELSFNLFGLIIKGINGSACNNTITNNTITHNQFQGIWLFNRPVAK